MPRISFAQVPTIYIHTDRTFIVLEQDMFFTA